MTQTPTPRTCIVIGAGIGGLSIAALMSKAGYAVTILEKNDRVGGRAMTYVRDGFTFDMGPSWVHMPEVYESLFARCGKNFREYVHLVALNPQYRMFFEHDEPLDVSAKLEDTLALLEKRYPGSAEPIRAFLDIGRKQYDMSLKHILYTPLERLSDLRTLDLTSIGKSARIWSSLAGLVAQYTKNPSLQKLLTYTALFVGGDPAKLPALYALLSYLDLACGVQYPVGGVGALIDGIKKLAEDTGTVIHCNEEVTKLDVVNGRIERVHTAHATYSADVVIANADLPHVETKLLDKQYQTYGAGYWKSKTIAPSAFVMYIGLNRKLTHVLHHMIYIPDDWRAHLDALHGSHTRWPDNPIMYISCPSRTDSTVAPRDRDQLFVTIQLPLAVDDTPANREKYAALTIKRIEMMVGESLHDAILFTEIRALTDFTSMFNAHRGTAIGLATTVLQSMFRPHHHSDKVQNLFYTGQYTMPGVGLAMGVIAAERTMKVIDRFAS